MNDADDYDDIGEVFDYQTPLKDTNEDKGVGKIDLVSDYYDQDRKIYLLELKREDSTESLLRCALEIFTYSKQIDGAKFLSDFNKPADAQIVPAILIFDGDAQHQEYKLEKSTTTNKLIKELGILVFTIAPKFEITKED